MFNKNIEIISRKFPHILQEFKQPYLPIGAARTEIEIKIFPSKTGLPVARVSKGGRQIFLNSPYDPEAEADLWITNLDSSPKEYLLLCGGGFLYHLKALLKNRGARQNFQRIIIYEPSLEILSACLQAVDWELLCGNFDFLLVAGENHQLNSEMVFRYMGYSYCGAFLPNLQIKVLPAYSRFFGAQISGFQNKIKEFIQVIRQNLVTLDCYSEQWLTNCFKNLRSVIHSPGIGSFFNRFSGAPAIVVSAGPSLEKNIGLVNAVKEKALIICAGSSIRPMLHHGVRPHFLVAIDGSEINRLVYNDLDLHDIYLVYNSRFFHEIVTGYSGPKIVMRTDSESFTGLFVGEREEEFGILRGGFSVSHTSLDLAVKLGCNPVILIGQDLAFSDHKRYAVGQVPSFQNTIDRELLIRKDIYGQDIQTSRNFEIFRLWFERMINDYGPEVKIINATEGGIPITGVPNSKLTDALAEYCRTDRRISKRIRRVYEQSREKMNQRRKEIDPLLLELKKIANQTIAYISVLLERLQELRRFVSTEGRHQGFNPRMIELRLDQITTAYDSILNAPQFDILLKELREGKLSVIKLQVNSRMDMRERAAGEDYDFVLQNCLMFFNETKQYLEFIQNRIQEIQPAQAVNDSRMAVEANLGEKTFELFRSSQACNDLVMANQYLEQCQRLNVKPAYCLRRLIKNHYLTRNYIRANNLITRYQAGAMAGELPGRSFYRLLKLECLCRLGLSSDARREYSWLLQDQRTGVSRDKQIQYARMRELHTERPRNLYQEMYQRNREFFREITEGVNFDDYGQIRFKVFPFISGVFIYDNQTGEIFPGIPTSPNCDLKIAPEDVLCIHNPNNPAVFQCLHKCLSGNDREAIARIPVFIIEDSLENWHLMMQLFEFKSLSDWPDIYICIAPSDEALYNLFRDENTPLPNIYYGTEPERFGRLLSKVIPAKYEF